MHYSSLSLLPALSALVSAGAAPQYPGFNTLWSDTFAGAGGAPPDGNIWNIALSVHSNNELQVYTAASSNLQLSGGETLQIVPWKSPSGLWTSGRVESKASFMPEPGKIMMVESVIRFGNNAQGNKQGMWPAFWMLGDSLRHGTPWPQCGELDIMETVNGALTGYGTVHCGTAQGGVCNEPTGRGAAVAISNDDWHTWTIKIDRTSGDWHTETITWLQNGQPYHSLTGNDLPDEGVWATLAHSPLYILLNMAVGGNWPGAPNGGTFDGYGSMMEVEYVAVYST